MRYICARAFGTHLRVYSSQSHSQIQLLKSTSVPLLQGNNSDVLKRSSVKKKEFDACYIILMLKYGVKHGLPVDLAFPLLPELQVYQ